MVTYPQLNVITGTFDLVNDLSGHVPYVGAIDNVDLGTYDLTCGNVTLSGGSLLANADASGILTLGGTGGTNDETWLLDCESVPNSILFSTGTGVTGTDWNADFFVGGRFGEGNRTLPAAGANHGIWTYSDDTTQNNDKIGMYHDQSNGIVKSGSGALILRSANRTHGGLGVYHDSVELTLIGLDDNAQEVYRLRNAHLQDELRLGIDDLAGNMLIVTNIDNSGKDHDHPVQPNPTQYWHSDNDPDNGNNEWGAVSHTATDFDFTTGDQLGEKSAAIDCTADNATDTFTDVAHGMSDTDRIMMGGTAVPTGVDDAIAYYVVNKATDTFQISTSSGGAATTFSDDGTLVQYYNWTGTARPNDIRLFYNEDDVADNVNGKSFEVWRRAAEGDDYITFRISQYRGTEINSSTNLYLFPLGGNIYIGRNFGSNNDSFLLNGYLTAAGANKSIRHQVSDTTDCYEITREDANILAMDIQMPLITDDILAGDKIKFTQVDGNEYIDSLDDGYMDYRATTAHRFGDGTNQLVISNDGVVTLEGTAKRILNLRPDLDYTAITAQGKPTRITYGAFSGYSLPIYAADEELFLSMNTPGRWDGASDVTVHVLIALSGAEDVNDDFNLQLSWEHADIGEPIENTTHDVEVETNLVAGRVAAYDTYQVTFTLDYDVDTPDLLAAHDLIAMRLRRIAAVGTEIAGEVIVLDYHMEFVVDKMYHV